MALAKHEVHVIREDWQAHFCGYLLRPKQLKFTHRSLKKNRSLYAVSAVRFLIPSYNVVPVVIFRSVRMLGGVGARRRRGSSPMARLTNTNAFGQDDNIAIIGDGVTRNGTQPPPLPSVTQALAKRKRVAVGNGPETFALAQTRLKLGDIM